MHLQVSSINSNNKNKYFVKTVDKKSRLDQNLFWLISVQNKIFNREIQAWWIDNITIPDELIPSEVCDIFIIWQFPN